MNVDEALKRMTEVNAEFDREYTKPFRLGDVVRGDSVIPFKVIDVWIGEPMKPRGELFSLLNMPGAE